MKKFSAAFFTLVFCAAISAQTTSQNWTHTDCVSGNTYSLFNMLDSNKVVVMEFEMGCTSCSVAAQSLETLKQSYDVSNPAQVKFFIMDYWSGHTCSNVASLCTNNNLTFGGFVGCLADKNYYTSGSPMPMIVVTGGANHTVYYEKNGYSSADDASIQAAINQALNDIASGVNAQSTVPLSVSISSNPAMNDVYLNITSNGNQNLSVEIINMLGESIALQKIELKEKGFSQVKLNLPEVMPGLYFVRYKTAHGYRTIKFMAGK